MGLLSALRSWLGSLFGEDAAPGTEPSSPAEAAGYECAICGTPVDDPEGECPLCRSTDLVPAGERRGGDAEGGEASFSGSGRARETAVADDSRTVGEVLGSGDVLSAHRERWERVESGYRVDLPDGPRTVDSRDEVRRLLFEQYGPPGE